MLTPLEIQNHEFAKKIQGYDRDEVRRFLYQVAESMESMVEQNHKIASELRVQKERVKDMESREKVLKDTLVSAQQIKADIRETAQREADLLMREAQLRADALYEDAKEAVDQLRSQLAALRRIRQDMLAESEMLVQRFNHFLEAEQNIAEEEDKVRKFTAKRTGAAKKGAQVLNVPPRRKSTNENEGAQSSS